MADHTTIEVAGQEVRISNPGKVFFPERGITKLDLIDYYLELAEPVDQPSARPADRAQAVRQRRRRGAVLPEADPGHGAGVAADDDRHVPERSHRARAAPQRRRPPRLGGEPRGDRLEPVAGTPPRPRPSRRAPRRPRPDARGELGRRAPGGARACATVLEDHGLTGLPEDERLARDPHLRRGSRPSTTSSPFAEPRWRWRARSSGARRSSPRASGGRRSATASSSTTTRTSATARSRRPTACDRPRTPASRRR